jgi:hypothetical protein
METYDGELSRSKVLYNAGDPILTLVLSDLKEK